MRVSGPCHGPSRIGIHQNDSPKKNYRKGFMKYIFNSRILTQTQTKTQTQINFNSFKHYTRNQNRNPPASLRFKFDPFCQSAILNFKYCLMDETNQIFKIIATAADIWGRAGSTYRCLIQNLFAWRGSCQWSVPFVTHFLQQCVLGRKCTMFWKYHRIGTTCQNNNLYEYT